MDWIQEIFGAKLWNGIPKIEMQSPPKWQEALGLFITATLKKPENTNIEPINVEILRAIWIRFVIINEWDNYLEISLEQSIGQLLSWYMNPTEKDARKNCKWVRLDFTAEEILSKTEPFYRKGLIFLQFRTKYLQQLHDKLLYYKSLKKPVILLKKEMQTLFDSKVKQDLDINKFPIFKLLGTGSEDNVSFALINTNESNDFIEDKRNVNSESESAGKETPSEKSEGLEEILFLKQKYCAIEEELQLMRKEREEIGLRRNDGAFGVTKQSESTEQANSQVISSSQNRSYDNIAQGGNSQFNQPTSSNMYFSSNSPLNYGKGLYNSENQRLNSGGLEWNRADSDVNRNFQPSSRGQQYYRGDKNYYPGDSSQYYRGRGGNYRSRGGNYRSRGGNYRGRGGNYRGRGGNYYRGDGNYRGRGGNYYRSDGDYYRSDGDYYRSDGDYYRSDGDYYRNGGDFHHGDGHASDRGYDMSYENILDRNNDDNGQKGRDAEMIETETVNTDSVELSENGYNTDNENKNSRKRDKTDRYRDDKSDSSSDENAVENEDMSVVTEVEEIIEEKSSALKRKSDSESDDGKRKKLE